MIYNVRQHTSTASCIDILAYLLLLPSAALAVALVSFRIESSEGDEVPGPNLVPVQNLGNDLENKTAIEV
jgi:hypothetical protein